MVIELYSDIIPENIVTALGNDWTKNGKVAVWTNTFSILDIKGSQLFLFFELSEWLLSFSEKL